MLKLLLCLMSAMLLAVITLQLRQQKLELQYQANQLHNQIERSQAKIWNQQLQIASFTAPPALAHTASNPDLRLAPTTPPPPANTPDTTNTDAE